MCIILRANIMRKKIILIIILAIVGVIFSSADFPMASKDTNLFEESLMRVKGKTIEYSITSNFTTEENGEEISDYILRSLNFYDGLNESILKNGKVYCVEFEKNDVSGYIETTTYENHNFVTVNIVKKDDKNDLEDLKNKIHDCLKNKQIHAKYFQYLKAKIPSDNIADANKEILMLLKKYKASNINTIELENGYSTTAYTRNYDSTQSDGKSIDFNYAVCKYSSGSYIIIGTPEIIVTY